MVEARLAREPWSQGARWYCDAFHVEQQGVKRLAADELGITRGHADWHAVCNSGKQLTQTATCKS